MHFMLYIIEISPDANLGSSRCVTQYRDDTVCHPAVPMPRWARFLHQGAQRDYVEK